MVRGLGRRRGSDGDDERFISPDDAREWDDRKVDRVSVESRDKAGVESRDEGKRLYDGGWVGGRRCGRGESREGGEAERLSRSRWAEEVVKRGILGEDGWAGSDDMADTPRFKDWRSIGDCASTCDGGKASIVVPRALGGERERLLCRGRFGMDWWVALARPRSSPVLVLLLLPGLYIGAKAQFTSIWLL